MRMTTAPDLFATEPPIGTTAAVDAPLASLLERPPIWPVPPREWSAIITAVRAFAARWHGQAAAAGFTDLQLYGLDPRAPSANLAAMGAAWLIARTGHVVLTIDRAGIELRSRSGARLRLLRRETAGAVLPWEAGFPR